MHNTHARYLDIGPDSRAPTCAAPLCPRGGWGGGSPRAADHAAPDVPSSAADARERALDRAVDDVLDLAQRELADEPVDDVAEAASHIAQLDPSPGTSFDPSGNPYIVPDVSFERNQEGEWSAILTNEYLPRLRLSTTYKDLVATSPDRKLRSYLRNQLRDGRTLIKALDQRQATILAISEEIISRQKEFLARGSRFLKPLTMNEIADAIQVHPATISRAVAGKHARTPHGVIEMRRFFASGYTTTGGDAISNQGVREALQVIIEKENRQKPLSDSAIQKILAEQGVKLARRTVAKYREQLNILPSHLRRSF